MIDEHRTWLLGVLSSLAADLGHPDPDHAARVLVLLVEGAPQGGQFDDSAVVRETLSRAVAAGTTARAGCRGLAPASGPIAPSARTAPSW